VYARLRGSLGPPPIGVRYRCSPLSRDAMRWVHIHNMFLSGTDFWRYLDEAYTSVPGSGGSNPLHAIPCVHGLSSSQLGAAATHPATDTHVKIMVSSTPPSHTTIRAELACIDVDLQLGHTHLLTDSTCSLRLIAGFMPRLSAYRHHIHRETLKSITHTLRTRCTSGFRTHLGKIEAHNHSLGNDHADSLANLVVDSPDTTSDAGL
jgi:hypothetical protein